MLRVTKIADYGVIVLTHFAGNPDSVLNARDIARKVKLPKPVVSKVLKMLARSGILVSQRGINGGYSLAMPPQEITIASIIHALEGPIAVTECTDRENGDCGMEGSCPVRGNWSRINSAIHQALDRITLSQMTRPLSPAQLDWKIAPADRSFLVP
ncbi:MAG: SUF system Fe-S cluster assembly regulator [Acidobacteria bacterium]|nr:SUF system Fe-S cluster assembly regulator [Acidobacteriota bacterium]